MDRTGRKTDRPTDRQKDRRSQARETGKYTYDSKEAPAIMMRPLCASNRHGHDGRRCSGETKGAVGKETAEVDLADMAEYRSCVARQRKDGWGGVLLSVVYPA